MSALLVCGAVACTGESADERVEPPPSSTLVERSTTTTTDSPTEPSRDELAPADADTIGAIVAQLDASPAGCDPLDTRACVLPFPSDASTTADPSSPTGRRVSFPRGGLPTNSNGTPIDVTSWNTNDGYSPNASLLAWFDDLDAEGSALPPWTDLQRSLDSDAVAVLVDAASGERVPLWAEVDADAADGTGQLLVVRPAISLAPATTYTIGLRSLVTTGGAPIEPTPLFRAFRDRLRTDIDVVEDRRASMEAAFASLETAGVRRDELQLAWSFTTASTENATSDILTMRGQTLAGLGTASPEFEITTVTENPEPGLARLVEGTYSVPNWMTLDGGPGTTLRRDSDGRPETSGVIQAPFACAIATAVSRGATPARAVIYGHGLLGSHLEVRAGDIIAMSNEHNALYCATKWAGFSDDDIPTAIAALQDLSGFPAFVDRMSQGFVNQLVLGRLVTADNGLVGEPAFLRDDGSPMLDNASVVFDGNSQGGIMGMALAAISTDFERAALGVVGMNYATLLSRSVDFEPFETIFVPAYPDAVDRAIGLGAAQMLWDRAEGGGFVRHVVDNPLPGSPPKDVLMHVAFGDWQVSELTAMVAARTMGVPIHRPVVGEGRSREVEPGWGIDTLDDDTDTSALVVWDSGSDPIPIGPVPPSTSRDPHGDPRNDAEVRRQKAAFLFEGRLIDVCNAGPCSASPR